MSLRTLRGAAAYLVAIAVRLHLAERPGEVITRAEVHREALRWSSRRDKRRVSMGIDSDSYKSFKRYAIYWLQFMGRLEEVLPPPPEWFSKFIIAYELHMRDERGLSPRTIEHQCSILQGFFSGLDKTHKSLRKITITEIDSLLINRMARGRYARVTVRYQASILRNFFRYAEVQEWCRKGLSIAIRGPRVYTHESLPLGLRWSDLRKVIAAARGNAPTTIRARAILMLLSVYGLRAEELVRLRLEDFDWEHEMLIVRRPKQRGTHSYPLSRPVGDAVLRYLKEVRPRSLHREVFLTHRAPHNGLARNTLWGLVSRRLKAAGLVLPHYGPHALRHACARQLLDQGLTLKEIGDHLGHRNPETTRIYAKVDLKGLRSVGDFDLGEVIE